MIIDEYIYIYLYDAFVLNIYLNIYFYNNILSRHRRNSNYHYGAQNNNVNDNYLMYLFFYY